MVANRSLALSVHAIHEHSRVEMLFFVLHIRVRHHCQRSSTREPFNGEAATRIKCHRERVHSVFAMCTCRGAGIVFMTVSCDNVNGNVEGNVEGNVKAGVLG